MVRDFYCPVVGMARPEVALYSMVWDLLDVGCGYINYGSVIYVYGVRYAESEWGAGVVCVWGCCAWWVGACCALWLCVLFVVRALFCGGMTRHGVSPYSSVVEHPLSKRKVGSSFLLGGISFCCSAQ